MRYWAGGGGERAVILIHGVGSYLERWRHTFASLAQRFRVFAFDLPGAGLSERSAAFSYRVEDLARLAHSFARAMDLVSTSLVGSSLGGAIAAHYARLFPDSVERIVLSSSAGWGRGASPLLWLVGLPGLGELIGRLQSREGTAALLRRLVYNPDVVTEELLELHYRMASQPEAWRTTLRLLRANGGPLGQRARMIRPLRRELPSLGKPVLLIWGDHDRIMPVAHARAAASLLPDSELHILAGCGHLAMLDRPAEYDALLLAFLSREAIDIRS